MWLQKKVLQLIFFHPSLFLRFLDPGSEIRDPGSEIRDPGWIKNQDPGSGMDKKSGSGIRDKHPGSATLKSWLSISCQTEKKCLLCVAERVPDEVWSADGSGECDGPPFLLYTGHGSQIHR
jgi:hypothetical protein